MIQSSNYECPTLHRRRSRKTMDVKGVRIVCMYAFLLLKRYFKVADCYMATKRSFTYNIFLLTVKIHNNKRKILKYRVKNKMKNTPMESDDNRIVVSSILGQSNSIVSANLGLYRRDSNYVCLSTTCKSLMGMSSVCYFFWEASSCIRFKDFLSRLEIISRR